MPAYKGPLTVSITSTEYKGDHPYATLKLESKAKATKTIKPSSSSTSTMPLLCTYDIPFYLSIPELMEFVAPVDPYVSHYRVLGGTNADTYMVLFKFRDPYSANNYYQQYNNRQFSSMEPEKCKVIYIESIEYAVDVALPFLHPEEDQDLALTCAVCLEPMDETTTGLLTILCQHTFHCHCLSKWGDGSCPVCRYSQKSLKPINNSEPITQTTTSTTTTTTTTTAATSTSTAMSAAGSRRTAAIPSTTASETSPERAIGDTDDENECAVCHSKEHLWICLICGYIGCGRYEGAHAYQHYRETDHLYSLEIETQRVWDYAGDGFVHRLIQNAVDGKLVELPSTAEDSNISTSQEKMEAISIEYSYLLTSQLDSQRIYYERQMDEIASQLTNLTSQTRSLLAEADQVQGENKQIEEENKAKEKQIAELVTGRERADKKLESWKEKCEQTKKVWLEEKEMTSSLLKANSELIKNMEAREQGIKELSDQVRDLMFYLETRQKAETHPELEGGTVETRTVQQPQPRAGRRGKGRR